MATTLKFCLLSILLQLTFILGTDVVKKLLEQKNKADQYKMNGGPVQTNNNKRRPAGPISGVIQALPGGISIALGKGVNIVKGFINHAGKYYDEKTGKEQPTDPFHSVDNGTFIVADCGTRVFQVEGNVNNVTVTPAATESAPTPPPVVVQPEERTLQEKDGKYVDETTNTTIVALFNKLSLARVTSSGRGNLMRVESTTPVDSLACPTLEERDTYWTKFFRQTSEKI